MGPRVYTLSLLLLFAHCNCSHVEEASNSTVPAARGKHHGGHGRPPRGMCDSDDDCGPGQLCTYGHCHCDHGFYFDEGCKRCPGYNEYCGVAQCCDDPALYYCGGNLCRCKLPDAQDCREPTPNNVGNVRMMTAFQVILASAFSIALFALLIQCWRTCWKKVLPQQRAVQARSALATVDGDRVAAPHAHLDRLSVVVRDAPPRYDELNHIQFEKPPPYQEAVNTNACFQVERQSEERLPHVYATAPMEDSSRGVENVAFTADDHHNVSISPHVIPAPENSLYSSQAATDDGYSHESQHVTNPHVVDANSGDGVVPGADSVNQQPASQSDRRIKQASSTTAAADGIAVCQVHRTG